MNWSPAESMNSTVRRSLSPGRPSFRLARTTKPISSQTQNKRTTTYTPENPNLAVPPSGTSENRAAIWTAVSQHRFHFCSGASTPHQVAALAKNLQKVNPVQNFHPREPEKTDT